jgi:capsule polysaccharide export protein KpsE/RkpR
MDEPITKSNDDEINLLEYVVVLAKHSRMIILASLAITVLTYVSLYISPNKYKATATLLPPQQNMTLSAQILDSLGVSPIVSASGGGGLGGLAAVMGLKSPGDLYVGMLEGNTILDRIIARFHLRQYYYKSLFVQKKPYIEDVRKLLSKRAEISSDKTGLISIEITDEDPVQAARMANAFMAELDSLLQEMSRKEASDHLAFLEKERTQTSQNLVKAEEALRSFAEQKSVIQIDAQAKGMLEYIANLRANIDAKEVQIQVLRQQATPANYDVIRLETELRGLKDKLSESEKLTGGKDCVGDVCIPTSKVPNLSLEYFRLYREVKFQEAIYQMYYKLIELARMESLRRVSQLSVVDQATPPEKRANKRILPALLAGFAACFIFIIVAFVRESLGREPNPADAGLRAALQDYLQPYKTGLHRLGNLLNLAKKPRT